MVDIFRKKTPSLAKIRKDSGEQFVIDYLTLWLIEINDMVNVENKMSDVQVQYTARLIINEHPLLTIADIKYVYDGIVSGRYGILYNRINSLTICSWFRKHWDDRLTEAANESYEDHLKQKPGSAIRSSVQEKLDHKAALSQYYKTKKHEK